MNKRKSWLSLIVLLILLVALPFLVPVVKQAVQLISFGRPTLANITVDLNRPLGELKKPWQNLAQGGEEAQPMLGSAINQIKALQPDYIRLDHIYDFYNVVNKSSDNQINYDWTYLDQAINQILASGAKPFLSLSYMPPDLAVDGNPLSQPKDWYQWQVLIQKTIERYSGYKNINNIYYEIWNEPDLFGGFKVYGDKNYLNLYYYAQAGAKQAVGVRPFKIGGPATTGLYPNWLETLAEKINEGWRIDFISWHHYQLDTDKLEEDFLKSQEALAKKIRSSGQMELVISEWGPDPEKNPLYDTKYAAIHAISGAVKAINKIHKLFIFEIKEGKSPNDQTFWGSWGLLTHENSGLQKKPRYWAVNFLNQLPDQKVYLTGQGTYVRAVAGRLPSGEIKVLLVNFDPKAKHDEAVPINFINLENRTYQYQQEFFLGEKGQPLQEQITTNELKKIILMTPNTALMISLKPI